MDRMTGALPAKAQARTAPNQLLEARKVVRDVYTDDRVKDYIVDIVFATREPQQRGLKDLAPLIEFGASPRATIALAQASRAHAFLRGRDFVSPDDVRDMAAPVLAHRLVLRPEFEVEGMSLREVVDQILQQIPVPR